MLTYFSFLTCLLFTNSLSSDLDFSLMPLFVRGIAYILKYFISSFLCEMWVILFYYSITPGIRFFFVNVCISFHGFGFIVLNKKLFTGKVRVS